MSRCFQVNVVSLKPGTSRGSNGRTVTSFAGGRRLRQRRKLVTAPEPTTVAPVRLATTGTSRKCSSWPWVTQMYFACAKSSTANHCAPQ